MYIYRFSLKFKVFFLTLLLMLLCPLSPKAEELDDSLFVLDGLTENAQLKTPFELSSSLEEGTAIFRIKAPENCYIYKDSLKLTGSQVSFNPPLLPEGVSHVGPQGPEQLIYGSFTVKAEILRSEGGSLRLTLQGCDAQGLCYPQEQLSLEVPPYVKADLTTLPAEQSGGATGRPFTLLLSFILGIGLVLTPCVLPMLSIYSAMILGHKTPSFLKSLSLNLSYLAGLSLTFALLGLIFARVGLFAHGFLQHPLCLSLIALLLLYLALDCMGIVQLKLPQGLIARLSSRLAAQNQGSVRSAFFFGALSSLLATPCTSAPLAGGILYILQSGDLLYGTLMFFMIGLGMGLPLVLIGLLGKGLLPKSGAFSELIHKLLALPLLYAAFYITEHLYAPYTAWVQALVFTLLIAYTVYCLAAFFRLKKALILLSTALSAALYLGSLLLLPAFSTANLPYQQLESLKELDAYAGERLIVTFSASWCHNCHELDKTVYASADYRHLTEGYTTLRFDLSDPQEPKNAEIIAKFKLIGVPQLYVIERGKLKGGLSGMFTIEDLAQLIR